MKRTLVLLCCQCLVVWCMAQTILADEAYAKAKSFMNTRGKQVSKLQVKTIKMEGQTDPACYVYNTLQATGSSSSRATAASTVSSVIPTTARSTDNPCPRICGRGCRTMPGR